MKKMTQFSVILNGLLCLVPLYVDAAPPCIGGHWINGICTSCPDDHFYLQQEEKCEKCPEGYVNPNGSLPQCKSIESNPEVIEDLPIPPTIIPFLIQSSLTATTGYTMLTTLLPYLNISKTLIPLSTTASHAINNNIAAKTTNPQNKNSNNTISVSYDNQHVVCITVASAAAAVFILIIIAITIRKCCCKSKSNQPVSNDKSQKSQNNESNTNNARASIVVSAKNRDKSLEVKPLIEEPNIENGNHTNKSNHLIDEANNENGNFTNQIQHFNHDALKETGNRTNDTTQI